MDLVRNYQLCGKQFPKGGQNCEELPALIRQCDQAQHVCSSTALQSALISVFQWSRPLEGIIGALT